MALRGTESKLCLPASREERLHYDNHHRNVANDPIAIAIEWGNECGGSKSGAPRRVEAGGAEQQHLAPPRDHRGWLLFKPRRLSLWRGGKPLRISRRSFLGLRYEAVHPRQHSFVLRSQSGVPRAHERAVAAQQNSHRTALNRNIIQPVPALHPRAARTRVPVRGGGLDIDVTPLPPLLLLRLRNVLARGPRVR